MRHHKANRKLGRVKRVRVALLSSLARSLLLRGDCDHDRKSEIPSSVRRAPHHGEQAQHLGIAPQGGIRSRKVGRYRQKNCTRPSRRATRTVPEDTRVSCAWAASANVPSNLRASNFCPPKEGPASGGKSNEK